MAIENSSTWIYVLFGVLGVWLFVQPSGLMGLYTAHRISASDVDRFLARMCGALMLSMSLVLWVNKARNAERGVIVHWPSIVLGVCAVVLLVYFVVGRLAKGNRRTHAEEARRRFLLPESEEETRTRYRTEWQKYRRIRVFFAVAFFGWLPFVFVLGGAFSVAFRQFHLSGDIWGMLWVILALAWIPFISIFSWQWAFWQCPRCGYAFKGIYDPFFPKRCHHCELPMWAESSDV
jgi:hypothetical protein